MVPKEGESLWMANAIYMHNRALHDNLLTFAEEAALQLGEDVSHGAEIGFELIDQGKGTAPLYAYKTLSDRFIVERRDALSRLGSFHTAVRQLAEVSRIQIYLRIKGRNGVPSGYASGETALTTFLCTLWTEATEFTFDQERFNFAYAELEEIVYGDSTLLTVIAPVAGLVLESEQIALSEGLTLIQSVSLDRMPTDLRGDEYPTVAVIRLESQGDDGLDVVGKRLRRLQTALRLWDPSEPLVGPMAWAQADEGPWMMVALGNGVRRTALGHLLAIGQEDEFRSLHSLVTRRIPRSGELAWGLRRFELGCERPSALEALTDWLLCLRALLSDRDEVQGENEAGQRLAALCGTDETQDHIAEVVSEARALERAVLLGLVRPEPAIELLITEFGGYLRAVLRDVLCGHLDPNLRKAADLAASQESARQLALV